MKTYRKGCRWYRIENGSVSEKLKVTTRTYITALGSSVPPCRIVVQPRGKRKWWLYELTLGNATFIATGYEPEPLIMRALLMGEKA